ncbi:hypothetical protein [Tellurirhabdus bombi]|uniref:hypothetical protein n=1 Tax=Tellurirhabdus bombi TaxID=2907205 RepID=UPI001F2AA961|nr:hypothetical protein [Tellurirhabdus bombi]
MKIPLPTLVFFLLIQTAYGQVASSDSALLSQSVRQAVDLYQQSFSKQSNLYSGIEYINYDVNAEGHPYFQAEDWEIGSIFYNGVLYEDKRVLYDVLNDKVVVQHPDSAYRVAILSEKVDHFSLLNHSFIRVDEETGKKIGLSVGFYDLLYAGPSRVLSRRVKILEEDISRGQINRFFVLKDRYYVLRNGTYHSVRSKQSVFSLFRPQRKALARYLRSQKIRFKDNREMAIIKSAQFYDVAAQ